MTKVAEFLQNEENARLIFEARWLIWDDINRWQVFERLPYAKNTKTIYIGDDLDTALNSLKDFWNEKS